MIANIKLLALCWPTSLAVAYGLGIWLSPELPVDHAIAESFAASKDSAAPAALNTDVAIELTESKDPAALAERALALSPDDYPLEFERLLQETEPNDLEVRYLLALWSEQDPRAVMEAILAAEDKLTLNLSSSALFSVWALREPYAAYESYKQHLSDKKVFGASQQVFYGLARVDPDLAFREYLTYDDYLNQQHNRLRGMAMALAEYDDLSSMLEVSQRAPDEKLANALSSAALRSYFRSDFEGTLRSMTALAKSDSERADDYNRKVVFEGLLFDAERTMEWASVRDDESGGTSLSRRALMQWYTRKSEPARDWLNELPQGQRRQAFFSLLDLEDDQ